MLHDDNHDDAAPLSGLICGGCLIDDTGIKGGGRGKESVLSPKVGEEDGKDGRIEWQEEMGREDEELARPTEQRLEAASEETMQQGQLDTLQRTKQ